MVCSVHAFVDPAGKLRELPNYVGRSFITVAPICTLTRVDADWSYCVTIDMGTVLAFVGWSGLDRTEPLAGFISDDLPGVLIYMPPSLLKAACAELIDAELIGEKSSEQPVKVRIADECESGEGE